MTERQSSVIFFALKEDICYGAPDVAVEILSPASKDYDLFDKLMLYKRYDVGEYWIVNPEENFLQSRKALRQYSLYLTVSKIKNGGISPPFFIFLHLLNIFATITITPPMTT